MKFLIINADDFGYSIVFNESILNLIENKLITSTTVMVNWINEKQENQIKRLIILKEKYNVSIGIHLEFNNLNFEKEIQKQYNKFIEIFNFKPSHLDIHKPSKTDDEFKSIQIFCKENNLLFRNIYEEINCAINKVINGTNMNYEEIIKFFQEFKENEYYEILFHPGTYDKNCKSSLNKKRKDDIIKIKKISNELSKNNIKLISYYYLSKN